MRQLQNIVILWMCFSITFSGVFGSADFEKEEREVDSEQELLIDDFSSQDGISSLGTEWEMITDQVMGGRSTGTFSLEEIDGQTCLRLRGDVSPDRRAGFIQASLSLKQNGRPFDGTPYQGLRLIVRGNGETYYIHFKNHKTIMPWQHYEASFFADEEWQEVEIPFDQFSPQLFRKSFDPKRLKTVAVVAGKKDFKADIAVARIAFYKKQ